MSPAWPNCSNGSAAPWSADEAKQFRGAARPDPLYAAFVLMILYGLRRGETLGLRWTDIDFGAGTIQVRQQLQPIQGRLVFAVATDDGYNRLASDLGFWRFAWWS